MKAICGFNLLNKNGNLDAWILPIDFEALPDLNNMEYFIEKVNEDTDHEVVECFAILDENQQVIYSKGIIPTREHNLMKEFAIQSKERYND